MEDTTDITAVSLGDVTVDEGSGTATISATIDNAPTDEPLVLTLDNGATITFAVGETTATSSEFVVQGDDPYVDGETNTVSISSYTGGAEYESLDTTATAQVVVEDTTDITAVSLGDVTVDEGSGTATISATIDNAPTDEPLVLTLDNGATITFAVGETTATSSEFVVQGDDPYVDGETNTVSISSYTGGAEYESLDTTATAQVVVEDTTDITAVSLGDVTVDEGSGTATISATIDNAPTDEPLVLTLDNGATITFAVGETTATSSEFVVQGDDPYKDGETNTVSISSYTGGAEYESLDTTATAQVVVEDTTDITAVSLGDVTVDEGSGTATISATIDNAPTDEPLVLTLDNGATITFAVGETTATSSEFVVQGDDPYVDGETNTVSISSYTGGAEYESLDTTATAQVVVEDTTDITAVSLGDVTVDEGSGTATISATIDNAPTDEPLVLTLDNGATITFAVGETTATSSEFVVQGDDPYKDGETNTVSISSYTGGAEYESLDTTATAQVVVEDTTDITAVSLGDVTVDEGSGTATISATIDNAPTDEPLVLTLDNGATITFAVGETTATSSEFVVQGDDPYKDGETNTVSISSYTGGAEYESLDTTATAQVVVEDTTDITAVSLGDVTVDEGSGTATISATIDNAPTDEPLVLTLDNGATITFAVGETTATSSEFVVQGDDPYVDGETNTVSISSYTGGAEYESLDTTATAQVVVEDTTDITAVSLGDVTVDEGSGTATISATIDNAPTDEPLVLTLDNGATITFAVGETTATSSEFVVQGDDPYKDGETNTVSISSYTGGAEYESLDTTATAQVVVEDTTDITAVSLGDVTVDEGSGTATISATIDNAPTDEPLVLTLDNGATITFAVGETTATSSEFVVQGDDPYVDGETNTVSISSYTGGAEYESLDTTATAQVVVEDTTDITAVSLGDVTVDEGSGTATISATIDNAPTDEPLVLTLDNGATITFAVGETTATSSEFVVQGDDPYKDGETNTVSISSYTGGAEYESLDTTATAQVVVEDTTDITAVSLGDVTVDEGSGTATISATIDNAPTDEPLVLTLDNGATITFAVGETTATSSEFVVQGDDPYVDGETNTVSISSYTGGAEYESLDTTATAQVVVEDTTDITAVSLGDVTVDEGSGTATISATIDNAPTDEPLVLTLDNGATITFAVGETTATSSEFVVQGDDPYVDGETNTVSISSYTGGAEYESLDTTATAQVVVEDTTDITAVSLGDVTVDEGSGTATISATIDNAPTDEPLVLTLDNGATITFAVGETTATSSEFVVQGDDPYKDGETNTVSISSYTGGAEYESLDTTATAQVVVEDTTDITAVSLGDVTVDEGSGTATISATIDNAPTDEPLVLTLDNGATITFAVGETTATSSEFVVQGDDPYVDGETNTVSISSYTGGAEYESLDTTATAQVVVEDTTDITAVSLGDVTVDEGSGTATISATIDNAPTDEPLVLTLDNGATITFAVGETTATSSEFVVQGDDPYVDGETNTVSISSYTGGAEYESLDTTATAQVVVEDTTDITAVSLGDVTVDEGSGTATISATIDNAPTDEPLVLTLDNGATITFAVGETTATSSEFVVQGDDPYKDGETNTVSISSYTGGAEYESLDTTATAQVVVEDTTDITAVSLGDVTVDEGSGTATISATIDNAPTDEPLVLTLDNGATITFAVGETTATSSEFVVQGDDPYVDGETNTVSISSYTGGAEYESLDTTATAQVVVEDTTDITAVSLGDVTVDEGSGTATISATIDNAPTDEPLVLTLDNGATITFAVGETTATSSEFVVQGDDPYVDGETNTVSISSYTGGAEYESLDTTATAQVVVEDTTDITAVSLGDVTVDEGSGTATISATIDNAPTDEPLVLTLDNGATITFAVGETTATSSEFVVQGDDPYVDGETNTVSISSYTGGAEYESLDTTATAQVVVEDTIDAVTVKLTATPSTGEDAGSIVYTASLVDANGVAVTTANDITVTLANNETITIAANSSSGDSSPVAVNRDDVYREADSISNSIASVVEANAGGLGAFENLVADQTEVSTTITDDSDAVTVKLTATPSTGEDAGSIVYTASLVDANGVAVTTANDITVTLANNETITIAANSSSGDSSPVAVNRDDVYREADSISNSIASVVEANAGGLGAFENLVADQTEVSTTITDDSDAVTVKLTATPSTGEEAGSIVYTASLVDANGNAVTTANEITVTLANNETITIAANSSSGDSSPVAVNRDDVYREADSISNSIASVVEANAGGLGAFENLVADQTEVSTTITDDSDAVTVKLTATPSTGEDAGSIVYTASLVDANGVAVTTANDITVTLANNETITIAANTSSGDSSPVAVNRDDVYREADSISNSIASVVEANAGGLGAFENLVADQTEVSTIILDDNDITTVTLSNALINEDTNEASITATVDNAPETDLILQLDNGQVITILAGQTSGTSNTFSVPTADQVAITGATGGNYEDLDTSSIALVDHFVTITGLDGNGAEVIVDEDDLPDGTTPNLGALTKTGSFSFTAVDGADDVTIGTTALVANGVYVGDGTEVTTAAYGTLTITGFSADTDATTGELVGGTFNYSYTLDDNTLTHSPGAGENSIVESLMVTVSDTDGDFRTASLDIQVTDDVPSITALTTSEPVLTVDETSLSTNASTSFASAFTSVYGADGAGSIAYALTTAGGASGLVDTATNAAVNLYLIGGQVVGSTATTQETVASGNQVFTVAVDSTTGVVTLDQIRAVVHPNASNPDDSKSLSADSLVSLNATITDKDGDSSTASLNIGLNLVFKDDGPTLIAPTSSTLINAIGSTTTGKLDADGNIDNNYGADGAGSISFSGITSGQASGLTSGGQSIKYYLSSDGKTLTGATGTDAVSGKVFTITLAPDNSTVLASDIYSVAMFAKIDNGASTSFSDLSGIKAGNLSAWVVGDGDTTKPVELLLTGSVNGVEASVNTNANDIAVANNNIDNSETLRIDFGSFTTVGATPIISHTTVNGFGFKVTQIPGNPGSTGFTLTAYDANDDTNYANDVKVAITKVEVYNGTTLVSTGTGSGTVNGITYTFDGANGVRLQNVTEEYRAVVYTVNGYDRLEIANANDDAQFSVGGISIVTVDTGLPVSKSFDLTLTDRDGDSIGGSFTLTWNPSVVPLAVDANQDGSLSYLSLQASPVVFDYNGDGTPELSAWVGPEDALLAYDKNTDGIINDGSEISFAQYHPDATTDLEGLRLAFDTNQDGVFDSSDAEFGKFGLWQDANSDGKTDVGEFRSLAEVNITSIRLSSDGVSYTTAEGDVLVHGSTSLEYADGTTGLVQDVSFATLNDSAEVSTDVVLDPLNPALPVDPVDGAVAQQPGDAFVAEAASLPVDPSDPIDQVAAISLSESLPLVDSVDQGVDVVHDISFASLIDDALANPELLTMDHVGIDPFGGSDAVIPDTSVVQAEVQDISALVDQLVAEQPVTDEHLADYQHDIIHTDPAFGTNLDPGFDDGSSAALDASSFDAAADDGTDTQDLPQDDPLSHSTSFDDGSIHPVYDDPSAIG
ncbi:immunoglobulin-like domain-containing protein [Synechococcus sp. CBW1006]|uniref:immunoglobulin-like domain-containing protein n=1 Tax=Synechococcus sp. CBW1006 TaxID=1353138 RepID=UPI0018CDFE72|nr:immunoglobulin-like domain-containing protein [Synechococcus sp. CBW1006]QPN65983.1 hypothetical protein H8F26_14190 [Synechococcus sp. CBW1006]